MKFLIRGKFGSLLSGCIWLEHGISVTVRLVDHLWDLFSFWWCRRNQPCTVHSRTVRNPAVAACRVKEPHRYRFQPWAARISTAETVSTTTVFSGNVFASPSTSVHVPLTIFVLFLLISASRLHLVLFDCCRSFLLVSRPLLVWLMKRSFALKCQSFCG